MGKALETAAGNQGWLNHAQSWWRSVEVVVGDSYQVGIGWNHHLACRQSPQYSLRLG
jgi:hypothetical protein